MAFHLFFRSRGPKNRWLQCYKHYCMGYALVELILLCTSAGIALFMQFFLCITSVGAQAVTILSILWMLHKSSLDSVKYTLMVAAVGEITVIALFPIVSLWSSAASLMCSDILDYSSNQTAVSQCNKLLLSRKILSLVVTVEIVLRILWILVCIIGYRGKISLMKLIEHLKELRRQEKEREMAALRERERRRKERRRKELKDDILARKEHNVNI